MRSHTRLRSSVCHTWGTLKQSVYINTGKGEVGNTETAWTSTRAKDLQSGDVGNTKTERGERAHQHGQRTYSQATWGTLKQSLHINSASGSTCREGNWERECGHQHGQRTCSQGKWGTLKQSVDINTGKGLTDRLKQREEEEGD